jgi:hypothetical protein
MLHSSDRRKHDQTFNAFNILAFGAHSIPRQKALTWSSARLALFRPHFGPTSLQGPLAIHVSRSRKIRDRRFGPTRVDRRRRCDCGRAPIEDCALRASALDKLHHLADHSRGRGYRRREASGRLTAKAVRRVTCCEGSQPAWSPSAASTGRQRTAME